MRIIICSFAVICVLHFFCTGCAKKVKQEKEFLAKVNDYSIFPEDLKEAKKYSTYSEDNLPDDKYFLDLEIGKQLLIQEAQRQGLDRNRTFMKTIERYWKQTLIKELLDREIARMQKEGYEGEAVTNMEAWIDSLRNKADVEINYDLLESAEKERS